MPQELSRVRTVEVGPKRNVHIQQRDPYGFWYIHYESGKVPKHLSGAYTSFEVALREVKKHLEDRRVQITGIKQIDSQTSDFD